MSLSTYTFAQCGSVSIGSFEATSTSSDGDITCSWTITFNVTNPSGSGNAGLSYSLVADDLGNGTTTTLNPDDGTCDETSVQSDGRIVTNAYTGSCDVVFELEWTGFSSPNCNGNSCNSGSESTATTTPVKLIEFSGVSKNRKVELTWITESEENNQYFEIQRSRNGIDFENLGQSNGQGNSIVINTYYFTDNNPFLISYYRLKQVNYNGSFEYSNVISVNIDSDDLEDLVVSPSLALGEITLFFKNLLKENSEIELFNVNGVALLKTQLEEGESSLKINIDSYEPGMYFIRVPIGTEYVVKRFVKIAD